MKTLVELEDNDCRFPFGEGPFLFCGDPVQGKSSYCAHHHAICYSPPHHRAGHISGPASISALRKRDLPAVMVLMDKAEA